MENKELGAMEIAPGLTTEEMKALFFDANALREPAYRLFQLNSDDHRYYYRYFNEEIRFYPSVTTLIKQVLPTSPQLIDWMIANGKDGSIEKRDLAAAYGTFMHGQFELLIINRRYDFDNVPAVLSDYLERENLPEKVFNEWLTKVRRDVLAFAQFIKDWNVRPLAVEVSLCSEKGFAGCVDLPCLMTDSKTGEDFTAIVDFKSGRKGFWQEHEIQLHLYRMMWNENFPDCQIDRVFNFSPKDWRKTPSYNLKDQTKSKNAAKIPHLLALAELMYADKDDSLTVISGVLDLAKPIESNYKSMSLADVIKSRQEIAPDATESVQISTNAPKPNNVTPYEKKSEKTAVSAFDVCEYHCKAKNCDYKLGAHGEKCIAAKQRAGFVENDLPWEKEQTDAKMKAEADLFNDFMKF